MTTDEQIHAANCAEVKKIGQSVLERDDAWLLQALTFEGIARAMDRGFFTGPSLLLSIAAGAVAWNAELRAEAGEARGRVLRLRSAMQRAAALATSDAVTAHCILEDALEEDES